MIKVVLDTNLLVSATFWIGQPYKITLLAAEQKITCFTSIEILDEYARILKRDFNQKQQQIEEKVKAIIQFSQMTNPAIQIDAIKEDLEDNKILEAGIEANADYIISGDRHLLKLKEFNRIKIITAREFLELMK